MLFTDDALGLLPLAEYDVTADGQRFVMTYPEPDVSQTQFYLVQHWFSELERLVPTP